MRGESAAAVRRTEAIHRTARERRRRTARKQVEGRNESVSCAHSMLTMRERHVLRNASTLSAPSPALRA